ncbi:MAG: hypothetical protein LKK36_04980 [Ewingella americana]|jgi:hypothetical protein|nr:hypothetical protein [Ewingella americana]MCI1678886.1 hypothetical protein [Ewingella americana]MCI1852470.1 hypothetical protein [Ewingella americana]MCI1864239.1 hypothetical protein [Ewingella americana]MCI2141920.1 hypothetical protein [Ewingella americana]MCI2163033.1 hypothetical protein [Ewingella americana]
MVSRQAVLRIARPTDNILQIAQMYQQGLGFELLGQFEDPDQTVSTFEDADGYRVVLAKRDWTV